MKHLYLPSLAVLALSAGCATSVDYGQVRSMSCAELNAAVGESATDISRTAVRRGNVSNFDVPFWILGAERAKTALVERDTRRIDEMRGAQGEVVSERDRRCRS